VAKRRQAHKLLLRELRSLEGVRPEELDAATFRLRCLERFWEARQDAGAGGIVLAAREVIATIRAESPGRHISETSVYRWDHDFRHHGVAGLVDGRSRRRLIDRPGVVRIADSLARHLRHQLRALAALGLAYRRRRTWFVKRPEFIAQCRSDNADKARDALGAWIVLAMGGEALGAAVELYATVVDGWKRNLSSTPRRNG
jgi:hypothetical protein